MKQPQGSSQMPRLLPSEVQLLLTASRPILGKAETARLAALIPQVRNWDGVIDTASRKHALPVVYENLASLTDQPPPDGVLKTMRLSSIRATTEMLHRQAAFDWLQTECVLPSGVTHAYLKGPALAARFYREPTQRFFRDVDILVPQRERSGLLQRMLERGCRLFSHFDSVTEFHEIDSQSTLSDFLLVTLVPHIMTPQGLVIEVHTEIDPHTGLFDTASFLRGARQVVTPNRSISVLPDTVHFAYACYHHTRHLWSKLYWLADLNVMVNHPEFDRDAVFALADRLGIGSTVGAALELENLVSQGREPAGCGPSTSGEDLLRACIEGLPGDLALEREMRQGQRQGALHFAWQVVPVPLSHRVLFHLRKFGPRYSDLRSVPGGPNLRWPRYLLAIAKRLSRALRRRLGGPKADA